MSCGHQHYMPLPAVSDDGSQSTKLADELAMLIHLGDLRPGAPLREVELADAHGVSRTIVRASLQRLEAQGLADIVLNKGARVRSVRSDAIPDLIELHSALSSLCARHSANRATTDQLHVMRRFVDMMLHVADEGGDAREMQHLRVGFSRALAEGAGPVIAERVRAAAPAVPHHDRALHDLSTAHGRKEAAQLARDVYNAVAQHDAKSAAIAAARMLQVHGDRVREADPPVEPQRTRRARAA